jgi:hypothetical protein
MEQQLMRRKIGPKYGIDPVQEVPAFSFADTEIERLFNALAPVKGNRDDIIARLLECAREYRWRRDQNQKKPTRAEQNAALKEVGELARDLGTRLRRLDMDTEWELTMMLPAFRTSNLTDAFADLSDRLEDFAWAAEQALRAGKQKSGPRIPTHVQRTVVKLASLYEEFTGERFSHNPKQLTKYDGEPHSRAGGFIVAFFEIVDPGIRPTSLSTAMASIVKSRRAPQNAAAS